MSLKEIECKKLARVYELNIDKADLNQKVDQKLALAKENFQMKGFRKGRTPLSLMKKMFGKSSRGEVVQEFVDESVRNHLEKSNHRPASRPSIDLKTGDIEKDTDLVFVLKYEILPKIPKFDYKKIVLEKYVIKVDETAIEKALDELAKSAGSFRKKTKQSMSKQGDQIIIDFSGSINGESFQGGAAQDYPLVLGSDSFIPGFEKQLIGSKVGEEKTITVKFPSDYGNKDLAGKESIFECKIKGINGPEPAKIDDELAKKFSAKNLVELKANIRERLENEYASFSKSLMKKDLMDSLEKNVKFELPQSLVDAEVSQILSSDQMPESEKRKMSKDKKVKASVEQIKLAKRRVTLGLFFAEEGNRNSINVSEKEYTDALRGEASRYPGKEKEFFKFMEANPSAREQISAPIFEEKVFNFMVKLVNFKEKNISLDQFKKKFDSSMIEK